VGQALIRAQGRRRQPGRDAQQGEEGAEQQVKRAAGKAQPPQAAERDDHERQRERNAEHGKASSRTWGSRPASHSITLLI